ncbi:MAG: amino acid ABC transporter permease [Spartobacteria bacterium]|nr:amino acid ABC transporter permease [Spartobacteria bacterium]
MFAEVVESIRYLSIGCLLTLKLYVVTIVLAIPLGFILALLKISPFKPLRMLIGLYTWVFRGTPLLLQLFFTYYGLSMWGISLSPFMAAVITFVINYGAYLTEIYRAGIESIDSGQYEAAKALHMSYGQTMRRIVVPQVIRRTLPPTCNEAINLVKDTALVAVIGMADLLRCAKEIFTRDFSVVPFIVAAAFYLVISSVLVTLFKRLETRYSLYE